MRLRVGNPSDEAHGKTLRAYDWIAPAGTDPHGAAQAAETALGLKLGASPAAEVHGFVVTSPRPDGALYVCVQLYDFTCSDADCPRGEGATVLKAAPDVTLKLPAMKLAVGEHATHKLDNGNAAATLKALGVQTAEEKLAARGSKRIEAVNAHTAKCATCGAVALTDGPLR